MASMLTSPTSATEAWSDRLPRKHRCAFRCPVLVGRVAVGQDKVQQVTRRRRARLINSVISCGATNGCVSGRGRSNPCAHTSFLLLLLHLLSHVILSSSLPTPPVVTSAIDTTSTYSPPPPPPRTVVVAFHHLPGSITSSASRRGSLDDLIASLGVDDHEKSTFELLSGGFDFNWDEEPPETATPSTSQQAHQVPSAAPVVPPSENMALTSMLKQTPSSSSGQRQRKSKKRKAKNSNNSTAFDSPLLILMKAAQQLSPNFMIPILTSKLPTMPTLTPAQTTTVEVLRAGVVEESEKKKDIVSNIQQQVKGPQHMSSTSSAASSVMVEPNRVIPRVIPRLERQPSSSGGRSLLLRRSNSASSDAASISSLVGENSPPRQSQSAPPIRRMILFSPEPLFSYSSGDEDLDKPPTFIAPAPFVVESLEPLYKEYQNNNFRAMLQRRKRLPSFNTIKKRRLPYSTFLEVDGFGAKRYKVEGARDIFSMFHPLFPVRKKRSLSDDESIQQLPPLQQQQTQSLSISNPAPSVPQIPQQPLQQTQQPTFSFSQPPPQLQPSALSTPMAVPSLSVPTTVQSGIPMASPFTQQQQQKAPPPLLPRPPQSQSAGPIPYSNYQQQPPRPVVSAANQWQSAPPQQRQAVSPLQQQQLLRAPILNANAGASSATTTNNNYNPQSVRQQSPAIRQVPTSSSDDAVFKTPLPPVSRDDRQRMGRNNAVMTPTPFSQPFQQQQQQPVQNYQGNLPSPQPQPQQWPVTAQQQRLQRQMQSPQYPPQSPSPINPNPQYQFPTVRGQQMTPQQQQQYLYNLQQQQQQQNRYPAHQQYGGAPGYSQYAPGSYPTTPTRDTPSPYGSGSQRPVNPYQNQMQQQRLTQMSPQYSPSAQSAYPPQQPYNRAYSPYPVSSSSSPYYPGRDSMSYYGHGQSGGYPGGSINNQQASVRAPSSSPYTQQQQLQQQQAYQMQNRLYNDPFSQGATAGYGGRNVGPRTFGGNPYANPQGYPTVRTPIPSQSNFYNMGQQRYGSTQEQGYPTPTQQQLNYQRAGLQQSQQQQSPLSHLQRQLQQPTGSPTGYPNSAPVGSSVQSTPQQLQQQYYGANQYTPNQPSKQQDQKGVASVDRFRAGTPQLPQQTFQSQQSPNYYPTGQFGRAGGFTYPKSTFPEQPVAGAAAQQRSFGAAGQGQTPTSAADKGEHEVSSTVAETSEARKTVPPSSPNNALIPTSGDTQSINSPHSYNNPNSNPSSAPSTPIPPEVISGGERVLFRPKPGGSQSQVDGLGGSGRGRGTPQESGGIGTGGNRGEFTLPIIDNPQAKSQLQKQLESSGSRQPQYNQQQQPKISSDPRSQHGQPQQFQPSTFAYQQPRNSGFKFAHQLQQAPGKSAEAQVQPIHQPAATSGSIGGPGSDSRNVSRQHQSPGNVGGSRTQPSQLQQALTRNTGGAGTQFNQQQQWLSGNVSGQPREQAGQQQIQGGIGGGHGTQNQSSTTLQQQQQALSGNISRGDPRVQSRHPQYQPPASPIPQQQNTYRSYGGQPIPGGGNVSAARGYNYLGYGTGQSEHLPHAKDRWDDFDGRLRNSTAWGPTGNRNDNGRSGQATPIPRPDTPQVPTTGHKGQQEAYQGQHAPGGGGGRGGGYFGKHLPHHGGDMPFYSQSEVDAHHQRVSHNSQTAKDTEFENDSTILSWYLQRAKQKLRDRQETPPHNKYEEATSAGHQTTGRGSSIEPRTVYPTSVQQGHPGPAQFPVTNPYSPAASANRSATPQYNSAQASVPSSPSYDRGLSSVSHPSQMVPAPSNTTAIYGSASPSGFNPNANQNGLSPFSRSEPSSPAPSSSLATPNIQGHGSYPGIASGSGVQQPEQPNNNGRSVSQSNSPRIPEQYSDNPAARQKRNALNPYAWYFPR